MPRAKLWKNKSNGTNNHTVPTIVIDSPQSSIASQLPYVDDDTAVNDDDTAQPLVAQGEARIAMRRNSVSLPSDMNKLELEALREKHNGNNEKVSKTY